MNEKAFLGMILHGITKSARYFKDSDSFLRQRRACPSKELHEKGIKILDGVLENLCERIRDAEQK